MVQIVVRARPDGVPWALLDLQGSIESNTDDLSGLTTGDIVVQPNGNAVLTLGQHRLDGKVAPLKKPLAVMAKRPASEEGQPPVYEVVAVISQKYVFKNRPQPIISDDAKFHAIGKSERP